MKNYAQITFLCIELSLTNSSLALDPPLGQFFQPRSYHKQNHKLEQITLETYERKFIWRWFTLRISLFPAQRKNYFVYMLISFQISWKPFHSLRSNCVTHRHRDDVLNAFSSNRTSLASIVQFEVLYLLWYQVASVTVCIKLFVVEIATWSVRSLYKTTHLYQDIMADQVHPYISMEARKSGLYWTMDCSLWSC